MAKVGYARVSSVGQSLDVQIEKLNNCDKLFEEKRSGTTNDRPMLKQCLNYVREGNNLSVSHRKPNLNTTPGPKFKLNALFYTEPESTP